MSEHFVYIENQFFITSYVSILRSELSKCERFAGRTIVNDVKIENKIGDALVHRIIRAHRDGVPWKCCIVIPLLPGFTFPVDHSDASAVRQMIYASGFRLIFSCAVCATDTYHLGVSKPDHLPRTKLYLRPAS
jgi:hypothetical protein